MHKSIRVLTWEFPWLRRIDVSLSNSMGTEAGIEHLGPEVKGDDLLICGGGIRTQEEALGRQSWYRRSSSEVVAGGVPCFSRSLNDQEC
jgi:hypothetical protein